MIYLHVPFCRSFCTYCDFYSEIACKGRDAEAMECWADEVCREISARSDEIASTLDLDTLYIGGGTPSVLPLSVLQRVLAALQSVRQMDACETRPASRQCTSGETVCGRYKEFTIEVNPEDIIERGPQYVQALLDLGVTRISMGVQSLDDSILRWMNRRHNADGARKAFRILSDALRQDLPAEKQACSLSIDLITGVPGMGIDTLESTLDEILIWHPEHISAYQLSIEEGSALEKMIEEGSVTELDEESCRAQYELICSRLSAAGYHHYEISNWAIPGHEAIHNSAYWIRHPYVGLGPGAHSLIYYDIAGKPIGRTALDGDDAAWPSKRTALESDAAAGPIGRAMPVQSAPCGPLTGPLPVAAGSAAGRQRRSWNSQTLSGWTSEGENLTPEQIHEEEVMLLARTDRGPIPERDWFIADEIILQQLSF